MLLPLLEKSGVEFAALVAGSLLCFDGELIEMPPGDEKFFDCLLCFGGETLNLDVGRTWCVISSSHSLILLARDLSRDRRPPAPVP